MRIDRIVGTRLVTRILFGATVLLTLIGVVAARITGTLWPVLVFIPLSTAFGFHYRDEGSHGREEDRAVSQLVGVVLFVVLFIAFLWVRRP